MFTGIKIFSSDPIWQKILMELNATVVDSNKISDVDLDELDLVLPISILDLKSIILKALDYTEILNKIFNKEVRLSTLQKQIVVLLYKNKGISIAEMKSLLGFPKSVTTHVIDTAIYELRKKYGSDFIINKDGKYYIGKS